MPSETKDPVQPYRNCSIRPVPTWRREAAVPVLDRRLVVEHKVLAAHFQFMNTTMGAVMNDLGAARLLCQFYCCLGHITRPLLQFWGGAHLAAFGSTKSPGLTGPRSRLGAVWLPHPSA
jgi:hypothetical protein